MLEFLTATQYTFEGKLPNEKVMAFLHRHWFTLAGKLTVFLILIILPIILYPLIYSLLQSAGLSNFTFVIFMLYYMAIWSELIYSLTMYLLDSWIVTDHRVINNTQNGFFNRTISETQLSKVQDVSVEISGLIPTLLHFGNVEIQTAGATEKFVFEEIFKPERVKDQIMILASAAKNNPQA